MDPKEMSDKEIDREMWKLDRSMREFGLTSEEEDWYDDLKAEWRRHTPGFNATSESLDGDTPVGVLLFLHRFEVS